MYEKPSQTPETGILSGKENDGDRGVQEETSFRRI